MSVNDSITRVKQQIKTAWLLTEAFEVVLAEIAAQSGYPLLDGPAVVYTHELQSPPEKFPSAELLGIGSFPRSPDSSVQFYDHTIDILWTVAGDDEATLVRHAETLVLATRRMSFRQILPMPGGPAASVIPGPEEYGPLMQSGGRTAQPLVKAARIRLVIPTMA